MYVFLENVTAICDVDRTSGRSNADDIATKLASIGYFCCSAVYDSRRHGSPQRRTRWWCAAVRVAPGPFEPSDPTYLHALGNRFQRTLERLEMEPARLTDVLHSEEQPQGGANCMLLSICQRKANFRIQIDFQRRNF
jgi:site-specific DNA-cytosine methylase